MRRRLRALLAVGVVGTSAAAAGPARATIVAPEKAGYWMEAQSATLPQRLPAPPFVPAGGLWVANSPDGAKAYSAVTYKVEGLVSATLVLRVFSVTSGQGLPSPPANPPAQPPSPHALVARVSACTVDAPWLAPDGGGPGVWEQRPRHATDCVLGQFSTDGTKLIFDLGRERQYDEGVFDLAIVPDPTLAPQADPPFSIVFEPPRDESLSTGEPDDVVVDQGAGDGDGGGPVMPEPEGSQEVVSEAQVGAELLYDSAFSLSAPALADLQFATPALGAGSSLRAVQIPTRLRGAIDDVVADGRGERVMAVTLLFALMAAWWWVGGRWVPAPMLVSKRRAAADATAPEDGIGRFVRPRSGRPRPLI